VSRPRTSYHPSPQGAHATHLQVRKLNQLISQRVNQASGSGVVGAGENRDANASCLASTAVPAAVDEVRARARDS